jgi:transcriptional regulator GlxA family with amidase domain
MNKSDLQTLIEIARVALSHEMTSGLIARELDLSDEELDRLFSVIEEVTG